MTATALTTLRETFVRCRDMDGSLAERLEAYSGAVRTLLPDYAEAIDRLLARLSAGGAGARAPRVGEPMPGFVLPDEGGRLVALDDLLSKGPVGITFHRGHWCPWCRISGRALAGAHADIAAGGGELVAILPERGKFATEFKNESGLAFPVLSDLDNGYAMSLNLAIWIGPDMERLLLSYGRTLPDYQANDAWLLPIPATFVVGRDGRVVARFVDPDFRRRPAIDELISAFARASRAVGSTGRR
jgi:peroxiredoxin